ncbi:Golgi-associated plant pathogenesis-related protein 1 [Orchesella cincta]|uniref:Golgi-associated plant pathogenesis-related protein 1 n=2 Tax=Orchesella cincta TaxID=48709 RepID=A0A1D2MZW8_ORCCI|nr:Golgi-associated plant pathogenesis-related protein 1 [Orchesella cincta]
MELKLQGVLLVVFISLQLCSGQQPYQTKSLNLHNQYRARHRSPPLAMDTTLNNNAVRCAQYYAQKRAIDHQCPYKSGAGENLIGGTGSWTADQFAESSAKMWYDEVQKYDYNRPGFSMATGHFTQLVWKNSQKLGFGYAQSNGYTAGVALYSPPGNYEGQYPANVQRP